MKDISNFHAEIKSQLVSSSPFCSTLGFTSIYLIQILLQLRNDTDYKLLVKGGYHCRKLEDNSIKPVYIADCVTCIHIYVHNRTDILYF